MEKETVTEASPGCLETPAIKNNNHDIGMLNATNLHTLGDLYQAVPSTLAWLGQPWHWGKKPYYYWASVYMSQTTHTTPDVLISVMVRAVVRVKTATQTMLQ